MTEDPIVSAVRTFRQAREHLAAAHAAHRDAAAYLAGHSAALDRAVTALYAAADLPAKGAALAAVGGYGRRELFPYSDIDVLVLLDDVLAADPDTAPRLTAFTTALWELGLSVGCSVRSRSEFLKVAATDVSVATTYLECRLLSGDGTLLAQARSEFFSTLDARGFFRDKMLELARRHQKHDDSPYVLEPNLKESPGGLRDLQVFLWCARAAGLADSVEGMEHSGLITEREMHAIEESTRFLFELRVELHLLAGRHEDRLIFDLQEALANRMGYRATAEKRASETLMKRYYLNAKSVVQLSTLQLQSIADRLLGGNDEIEPVPLEEGFVARGDEMDLTDDEVYRRDPNAVLRTFLVYGRHRELSRLSTRLLRTLWHAVFTLDESFATAPENRRTFLEILAMPKGTYHALKLMNIWGVLSRFLPPWRHTVGQMQHDLYHIFTVDQHTLRAVRNMRRLARSDFAHEYPFCSKVMTEIPRQWRLILAALLHDIGKGLGGRHEEVGAEIARSTCAQLGLSSEDLDFVVFLVRHHLTMSQIAQKQDISDPAVVERFLDIVKCKERLDALYLLTVCDIRATSPKVWTRWKGQLIETLYRASLQRLEGESGAFTMTHALAERRHAAEVLLEDRVDPATRERFWKELDLVYFMRHSAEEIAWHTQELAERVENPEPCVRALPAPEMGGVRLFFYLPDRKHLFLRAVAQLGKRSLSVIDARIYTTARGFALDTFVVADTFGRLLDGGEATLRKFEADLAAALVSEKPLPAAPKGKLSRRSKHFPIRPIISIIPDDSGRASILNVVCTDRIGLLYLISEVLSRYGINLQTAKIATLGERVEDVFLIDGPALAHDEEVLALEAELVEVVAAPVA